MLLRVNKSVLSKYLCKVKVCLYVSDYITPEQANQFECSFLSRMKIKLGYNHGTILAKMLQNNIFQVTIS